MTSATRPNHCSSRQHPRARALDRLRAAVARALGHRSYVKLPQPAEEYTPVQVNDKLYLIGGNAAVLTPGARLDAPRACDGLRPRGQHVDGKEEHAVLHRPHERRHREREDLYLRRLGRDDAGGAERHARHRVGIRSGGRQLEGAREVEREAHGWSGG